MMACFAFVWILLNIAIPAVWGATVLEPVTCRPALPVDWFIREARTTPTLSQVLVGDLNAAATNLSSIVDLMLSDQVDAVSVVVAGPWGHVAEYNVGKLRSNDSSDLRTVDIDSIYRIASISKVSFHLRI